MVWKKLAPAFLAIALLEFLYFYFYVYLGLGGTLKGWPEIALAVGSLLGLTSLLLFLLQKWRSSLAIAAVSVATLVGIIAFASQSHKAQTISFAEFNRAYNERVLGKSLEKASCTNGDIAVIYPSEDFVRKEKFLALSIVPAKHEASLIPIVSSSRRNPKLEEALMKEYLNRTGARCKNAENASLEKFWASLDAKGEKSN